MSDPTPHGKEPYRAPANLKIACAKCGAPVPPSEASWSEQGEQICKNCEAVETIETGDQRALSGIVGGGMGSFFLGFTSLCFNPLLVMSFLAIASGIGTLVTVRRHPEYREKMAWRLPITVGGAALGILLGLVHPAIMALAALGMVGSALMR